MYRPVVSILAILFAWSAATIQQPSASASRMRCWAATGSANYTHCTFTLINGQQLRCRCAAIGIKQHRLWLCHPYRPECSGCRVAGQSILYRSRLLGGGRKSSKCTGIVPSALRVCASSTKTFAQHLPAKCVHLDLMDLLSLGQTRSCSAPDFAGGHGQVMGFWWPDDPVSCHLRYSRSCWAFFLSLFLQFFLLCWNPCPQCEAKLAKALPACSWCDP